MIPRDFPGLRRVLRPFRRPAADADDEIRFHLDMRTQELIDRGMSPEDARTVALRTFGDVNAVRSQLHTIDTWEARRMTIGDWFDSLRYDLRHALRTLRREPALVAGVVLTFALAIGANAAMFGLVRQLMLAAPPGITDPQHVARAQLIRVSEDNEVFAASTMSYPAFLAIRASAGASNAAAATTDTLLMGSGASATRIAAIEATGDYFSVLGAKPYRGRFFGPGDDLAPDGNLVVVLGHAFWQRQYDGDPAALGREIVISDQRFTIVGVAPAGFNGDQTSQVDVFVPLSAAFRGRAAAWRTNPGLNIIAVVARLRDGVAVRSANEMATASFHNTFGDRPGERLTSVAFESVLPGKSARQTLQARIALWLAGVAIVVLLIATANVATLLLVRAVKRRREMAVRIALGVGRARLARQLLTESLVLAAGGALAGLLVAQWFAGVVRATLLPSLAPSERLVEPPILIATIAVACIAGLLAGLAPLIQVVGRQTTDELHGGSAQGSVRRSRMQASLVGVQVALCMTLLVGAGAFVRSLDRVTSQDLGFSTARLLVVELNFRDRPPAIDRDMMYADLAKRIGGLSGVTQATTVDALPFGFHHIPPISVPGHAEPPGANVQLPIMYGATPAYLDLLNVKLVRGRRFTDRDGRGTPLVVLVNETMAREVWPGESALGKCIRIGYDGSAEPSPLASPNLPCREVVGVVRDSRARSLQRVGHEAALMQYYVPFAQVPPPPFPDAPEVSALLVGVSRDADKMVAPVQQWIQGANRSPVFAKVRPYQDLLDPQLRPWRLGATLFSMFGALALGIAAVGLFGVISCLVTQRTKEIGIRLALGGTRGRVASFVVGQSVRMVAVGLAVGAIAAFSLAPLIQSMLFETSARELAIVLGASGTLLAIGVIAAVLPAWRASTVDPLSALRNE